MNPQKTVVVTKWLLRIIGGSTCLAFFPIFFPLSWMEMLHGTLGLGELPRQPIFEYLARSLSAMYCAHGTLVLAISTDVLRYRPLIGLIGCLNICLGLILLGTDLVAPMPWFWTVFEGPPIVLAGAIVVWLWMQIRRVDASNSVD